MKCKNCDKEISNKCDYCWTDLAEYGWFVCLEYKNEIKHFHIHCSCDYIGDEVKFGEKVKITPVRID